jgi:hypothetical protein
MERIEEQRSIGEIGHDEAIEAFEQVLAVCR